MDDFRRNAKDCRDLAGKMPAPVRDQLLGMARSWDELAEERERMLAAGGGGDQPDAPRD